MFSTQSVSTSLKALTVAEYLLLIQPRKDLSDAITGIKQDFYGKYKAPEAIKGKPHLTLVNFVQYTTFESRIRQRLRQLASDTPPLFIELYGYGSFPSHTIFINVVSKNDFQQLVKSIRTHTQALMKLDKDNRPHFILEPHITIARRLKPWQYEQGWLEYQQKNFSGKFMADAMILLRKEVGEQKFSMVEKFDFQDPATKIPGSGRIIASQAALF